MRYVTFLVVAIAAGVLSGCLSLPSTVRNPSRLPLETIDQGLGELQNVRAHEHGDRLIVSGSVWTIHVKGPSHVDIRLLSSGGGVLAERHEEIERRRSTTAHDCRHAFIASFPNAEVKRAAKVQVVYHDVPHR